MKPELLVTAPILIREYLGYMETVKGRSALTVEEYFLDLRTFFRFFKRVKGLAPASAALEEIDILDVDLALCAKVQLLDVFEYMNYMNHEKGNQTAARARKASSLRSFFKYLTAKTGKLKENPLQELETPKLKKSLPKHLTLEQSLELLANVQGKNAVRDYAILTLFLNCGLRLAELVSINITDIRPDHTMRVVGKGNKERIVYLNTACLDAVNRYLNIRPKDAVIDREALFLSNRRKRISREMVQFLVKKHLFESGMAGQGFSTHKLRHTAATLMYQHGGVDIRVLKEILGHENLNTTEIYTHLSSTQMEEAAEKNPLSEVKRRNK